jgi:branched-chain amino acid transport system permease protein
MSESLLFFVQQLINGLSVGSVYALIAIGYTMVYGIIGLINFAHGEVYMIGTYICFAVVALLTVLGIQAPWILMPAALVVTMAVSGTWGYAIERVAYRPLRGGNRLTPLITAIGVSIVLQNLVRLTQGSRDIAIPPVVSGGISFGNETGFQASLGWMQLIIFVVTLVTMAGLSLFIARSRTGRACRACAEDIGMTRLLGIDADRIIALTFVIGATLAAVASVLLGFYYGVVNPWIGFLAGLKAFTAAVLGGIGSIPGAMLGGLLLGVTEALTAGYFSPEYKDVVSFGILILVLLFVPTGILGRPEVEKV